MIANRSVNAGELLYDFIIIIKINIQSGLLTVYLQWELQIEAGFVHTEARGQGELQVVEAVEENELYYV